MIVRQVLRARYKIIEQKGDGAFGVTYLAEDTYLPSNDKCIVKHLKPKSSDSEILKIANRLFSSESDHLFKLGRHDQIPCLYDSFQENNEFYLVQEYIDGKDLCSEITPDTLWDEEKTIDNLKQILEVLAFVHRNDCIHRDIKPNNIIRRQRDGKLVLIDFGAVKEISTTIINQHGQAMKTVCIGPSYMPKEQENGEPKLASDIFAVGIIAIFGLIGSTNTTEAMKWRNSKSIKVSDKLVEILDKMTRSKWKERYQSADEALKAIEQTFITPNVIEPTFIIPNEIEPTFIIQTNNSNGIDNENIESFTNLSSVKQLKNWSDPKERYQYVHRALNESNSTLTSSSHSIDDQNVEFLTSRTSEENTNIVLKKIEIVIKKIIEWL